MTDSEIKVGATNKFYNRNLSLVINRTESRIIESRGAKMKNVLNRSDRHPRTQTSGDVDELQVRIKNRDTCQVQSVRM